MRNDQPCSRNYYEQPKTESGLSQQLLGNFQSENSCSSVFWTDFGETFNFQAKKEFSFPCIPIFKNL